MALFSFLQRRKAEHIEKHRRGGERRRLRAERNEWRSIAKEARLFASWHYVRGEGVEISGFHRPLPLFNHAHARAIHRRPNAESGDDLEMLATMHPESCEFVVATHEIRESAAAIAELEKYLRVLRPGGAILLTFISDPRPDEHRGPRPPEVEARYRHRVLESLLEVLSKQGPIFAIPFAAGSTADYVVVLRKMRRDL